ncbi:phasin family protein [Sphingomonas bacterium]|uniref:phasin family protein n=1 Tax=Sphingomonas bacterium TaxID=1895847 RepID=UPI0015767438|nr:phasin family protein [Sphingomonas bacterium]
MDETNTSIDQAKTIFADATERAKGSFAKGQQIAGELGDFNKGNVEAIVESSKIAIKGMEQFGQTAVAYVRSSLEESQAQARTLAAASSPTEFLKLQGEFARTAFDRMIAETSKNTEAMMKFAGEIAQPISDRMALAADRMKVAA